MDPKNELSDREKQLMALAWLCFSEKPKVDYKKLAGLAGMTNPASAGNAWAKIQKKIAAQAGSTSDSGTPEVGTPRPKATPKTTPGKKRGAKAAADGETPVKKAKTPKKVKDEPVDEEELTAADSDAEGEIIFNA